MRKRFLLALGVVLIPALAHSSPPSFNFSLANGGNQSVVRGEFFNISNPPTLIDSFTITADPFASPP